MFMLMGLQLLNSAGNNTVTVKLHAFMYKHALFENKIVMKLGFRVDIQQTYAGSYFTIQIAILKRVYLTDTM